MVKMPGSDYDKKYVSYIISSLIRSVIQVQIKVFNFFALPLGNDYFPLFEDDQATLRYFPILQANRGISFTAFCSRYFYANISSVIFFPFKSVAFGRSEERRVGKEC
jgi:hypothetical protein